MMGQSDLYSDSERISMTGLRTAVLIQSMRVSDGRADGIAVEYTGLSRESHGKKISDQSQQ